MYIFTCIHVLHIAYIVIVYINVYTKMHTLGGMHVRKAGHRLTRNGQVLLSCRHWESTSTVGG